MRHAAVEFERAQSAGAAIVPERASRDMQLAERLRGMGAVDFTSWLLQIWYRAPLWGAALSKCPTFPQMILRRSDGVRPADRGAALERGTLCLDELYVDNNPASEEATRRVNAFFGGGDDDAARAAQARKPADARQVCESLSVSIYSGLGSSCVVQ